MGIEDYLILSFARVGRDLWIYRIFRVSLSSILASRIGIKARNNDIHDMI